nr:pentapeptide repeat-containing protein [uncultured Allomuricauda sp.]
MNSEGAVEKPFICDTVFKGADYTQKPLPKAEYEHCVFQNCVFCEGFLDNQNFMECEFLECDLTNTNVKHTIFKECFFKESKLIGLSFKDCDTLFISMNFEKCNLSFASFYALSLSRTKFMDCNLHETDFTETNLTGSWFQKCNLDRTIFQQTVLDKVDFTTAFNFSIDPGANRLKKARFSKDGLIGLLKKYDIVVA